MKKSWIISKKGVPWRLCLFFSMLIYLLISKYLLILFNQKYDSQFNVNWQMSNKFYGMCVFIIIIHKYHDGFYILEKEYEANERNVLLPTNSKFINN